MRLILNYNHHDPGVRRFAVPHCGTLRPQADPAGRLLMISLAGAAPSAGRCSLVLTHGFRQYPYVLPPAGSTKLETRGARFTVQPAFDLCHLTTVGLNTNNIYSPELQIQAVKPGMRTGVLKTQMPRILDQQQ